jgi:hypothetical protein
VQARGARHADATTTKETAPASYFFLITSDMSATSGRISTMDFARREGTAQVGCVLALQGVYDPTARNALFGVVWKGDRGATSIRLARGSRRNGGQLLRGRAIAPPGQNVKSVLNKPTPGVQCNLWWTVGMLLVMWNTA